MTGEIVCEVAQARRQSDPFNWMLKTHSFIGAGSSSGAGDLEFVRMPNDRTEKHFAGSPPELAVAGVCPGFISPFSRRETSNAGEAISRDFPTARYS